MKYVGAGVPGLTNRILVTGSGTYTADVQFPGMCTIAILRSLYAHAYITSIDTSRAEAEPGVVAVPDSGDYPRAMRRVMDDDRHQGIPQRTGGCAEQGPMPGPW